MLRNVIFCKLALDNRRHKKGEILKYSANKRQPGGANCRLHRLAWALALCLPLNTWAQQALIDQAQALVTAGKPGDAYLLLEASEEAYAGDAAFDYLLASTALNSGRPSKAIFVHERILAVDPSYLGVRADMGLAYYALGDHARAKIEFEAVLAIGNLPPDLRSQVEQYVRAIDSRGAGSGTYRTAYIEFGFGRDSNIGSATEHRSLNLPAYGLYQPLPPIGLRRGDNYSTLALGGEVNHALNERLGVYAGADYRIRDYRQYNDPNTWTLDGRAGLSYSGNDWLLRAGVLLGEYRYNAARLRHSSGANVDWRRAIDASNQITVGASVIKANYLTTGTLGQDVNIYSGSVGWLRAIGGGNTVLGLSGTLGYEESLRSRDDGDRRFWGPRLTLQSNFTSVLGGYVTTGATHSVYSGNNTSYQFARNETTYDLTMALNWAVAKGVALRPQLSHVKNVSNATLYSYDKTDLSLNLRFDY